jgi:prevent-host-death family protein
MHSVSFEYAQTHLAELLVEVAEGEEIVIERDGRPLARLVAEPLPQAVAAGWAGLGRYEGQGWMAPDFNNIPEGFEEYVK